MIRIISLTMSFLCLSIIGKAQLDVTHNKTGISSEGINYFLPKTNLQVIITATKTTYYPGFLAEYAPSLLRVNDAPQEKYSNWLLEQVEITPYGSADSTKFYSIKYKPKYGLPSITLASDGRLLSINEEPTKISPLVGNSITPLEEQITLFDDYRTRNLQTAGDKQTMAEQAADEIFDIRDSRSELIKGEAEFMPKDGTQLKLMLQKLDEQEKALLRLFYGTQKKEKYQIVFNYTPDTINVTDDVLFRFSKFFGVVDKDDLSGEPIYISTSKVSTTQSTFLDEKKSKPNETLIYNIPGILHIYIHDLNRIYYNENIPIAQIGHTESLGNELFNKRTQTKVSLSPIHGGILHIESHEK